MSRIKTYWELKKDIEAIDSKYNYRDDIKPLFGFIDTFKSWDVGTSEQKFRAAGLGAHSNYSEVQLFLYNLLDLRENKMYDVRQIVNRILEGADVRSALSDL